MTVITDEWLKEMIECCPQCEEAFMRKNSKQKFCSPKCSTKWHNNERQRLVKLARQIEKK